MSTKPTSSKKCQISFKVLKFIPSHYDGKDLVSISLKIKRKEYNASFIMNNYDIIFFPEFKALDRYASNGHKVLANILTSIHSKTRYYIDTRTELEYRKRGFNDWQELEWWQESEIENSIEGDLIIWIKENDEYLSQIYSSEIENEFEEIIKYLSEREKFSIPKFATDTVGSDVDVKYLNKLLDDAIKGEDYEKAVKIREQLNKIK
jgi:hypothetical protein